MIPFTMSLPSVSTPSVVALCFFIHSCTIVRGVHVGVGHGPTKGIAKRDASAQALEYLKTHGKGPPATEYTN
jgi:hypothetical protein